MLAVWKIQKYFNFPPKIVGLSKFPGKYWWEIFGLEN